MGRESFVDSPTGNGAAAMFEDVTCDQCRSHERTNLYAFDDAD